MTSLLELLCDRVSQSEEFVLDAKGQGLCLLLGQLGQSVSQGVDVISLQRVSNVPSFCRLVSCYLMLERAWIRCHLWLLSYRLMLSFLGVQWRSRVSVDAEKVLLLSHTLVRCRRLGGPHWGVLEGHLLLSLGGVGALNIATRKELSLQHTHLVILKATLIVSWRASKTQWVPIVLFVLGELLPQLL